MSKHAVIAENVIRCEGLAFALAANAGKEGDMREARDFLKTRIVKELDRVASERTDELLKLLKEVLPRLSLCTCKPVSGCADAKAREKVRAMIAKAEGKTE